MRPMPCAPSAPCDVFLDWPESCQLLWPCESPGQARRGTGAGRLASMGNSCTADRTNRDICRFPHIASSRAQRGDQLGDGPDLLPALDNRLYAIHYSGDTPKNNPNRTPSISAIVVQHVCTGYQEAFASLRIAEKLHIPATEFLLRQADLEKLLLKEFFDFVGAHQEAVWLHWYMHDFQLRLFGP